MNPQHAVAVLIIAPEGVPLIRDPKKPAPRYWKLPGGRSEGSETAVVCAAREIDEELGIEIDPDALRVIEEQDRETHTLNFFAIELRTLKGIKAVGDEQEEIRIFPAAEVKKLPDLFPNHRPIVEAALKI